MSTFIQMPGCRECAIPFPKLAVESEQCARCIKKLECNGDAERIEQIQQWKQCSRCGHSASGMVMDVSRCFFCASPEPEPRTPKGKHTEIISLDSSPGSIQELYEHDLVAKRNEIRSSDIRYKGDKTPKIALVPGKHSFGSHDKFINIKSEGTKGHQALEISARQKATNHKAGINVVIQLVFSKLFSESELRTM